ncbi:hypothetical protein AK812_SmicGene48154, partial [Symbiodinium microadriaticum]
SRATSPSAEKWPTLAFSGLARSGWPHPPKPRRRPLP